MRWHTPGFENLELSTQLVIGEALHRGHVVDVLDADANFIRIRGNGRLEYIRQATRTSADTYISALIMENKKVTKLLLSQAGIRVPAGADFADVEEAKDDYRHWCNRDVVVKPNSTNFGIAVSMLRRPFSKPDFDAAVEAAFREDSTILLEELIPAREYRFLVVGEATQAVLHRVPANVVGDGGLTVAQLIEAKNRNPLRGHGYKSPLEKIQAGEEEARVLRGQGLSLASVPEAGQEVLLRRNSNISTGGDSINVTDEMHEGYKELAAAAASAVGARICGINMMVSDVHEAPAADNYAVIELNFNPALHIHDFPFRGTNRHVEKPVLDLLGL